MTVRVDIPPGEPNRPLSLEQIESKFKNLAVPVIGHEKAQFVISQLWKGGDVRTLLNSLRPYNS